MNKVDEINEFINKVKKEIKLQKDENLLKIASKNYKELKKFFKYLSILSTNERKKIGQELNELKKELKKIITQKKTERKEKELPPLDFTLPPNLFRRPNLHPITQTLYRMVDIFRSLGFKIINGPDIETDYYNFEALNISAHHPARDLQDTFYISSNVLLRTHTSPVQIRVMEKYKPPIRMITYGNVYRHDAIDATHSIVFNQLEGLCVSDSTSFAELKGTLFMFVENFFQRNIKVRFRPSYFPFTEPSAEMDISCLICNGEGCRTCKFSGWLEMLGCGMVHPKVFERVNYDPDKWKGYAFGLGVERFAMLKFRIDDLRLFYENDLRFLSQF